MSVGGHTAAANFPWQDAAESEGSHFKGDVVRLALWATCGQHF